VTELTYYHGTNMIINTIDFTKCRLRTDFGKGFYLTDKTETAQNWAIRRMEFSSGTPTVLRYDIHNGLFTLHGKRFESTPSLEWIHFICLNRRLDDKRMLINEPRHDYNWVSGPIANDKIANVIDDFLEGEITDVEAVHRARALPFTFQLSLHTTEAINYINALDVVYKQYKNNKWSQNWQHQ